VSVPVVTTGKYKIRITWPVQDGNTLLTTPDLAPGDVTQNADETFDGPNDFRCARIGVEVVRHVDFTFASALGIGASATRSASVARGIKQGDGQPVIGALNILEPVKCDALLVSGQGSLAVQGQGSAAGVLAIESSGREQPSGKCPSSKPQVLDIKDAANDHNFVRVDGSAGAGKGVIEEYSLWSSPVGNSSDAYDPADLTGGTPLRLAPRPTVLETPTGAKPVTDKFDCTVVRACTATPAPYITNLVTAYGGTGVPGSYSGSQSPYSTTAFDAAHTLPGSAVPTFQCNMSSNYPTPTNNVVTVPPGNWYVTCSSLKVSNQLIFKGGNVVLAGDLTLGSDGCFVLNSPATACPTINTSVVPKTSTPAPVTDSILYIRSGGISKTGQASLFLPQTFVYMANGAIDLGGGGTGKLLWTTPLATDCAATADPEACARQRFSRLCLWSESTLLHSLSGQAGLEVRGVFFIPNALFDYSGQGDQDMDDAQFWVKTMSIGGQGTLTMSADPTAAVERYTAGVALIR
jgi:hypothetical protein